MWFKAAPRKRTEPQMTERQRRIAKLRSDIAALDAQRDELARQLEIEQKVEAL